MADITGYVDDADGLAPFRIRWQFNNLSFPASSYSLFEISTNDGYYKSWSDGTSYDWTDGHAAGYYVVGTGYATYQGTRYSAGTYAVMTPSPPQPPPTPTGLTVSVSGYAPATVTASWNSSSGATGYNWSYYGPTNGSGAVTTTSKQVFNLPAGSYTWYVSAYNGNGTSSETWYNFTVQAPPQPPGPISSFSGYASAGRMINCSWSSASGADYYEVWVRAVSNGVFYMKYQGSATSCSFQVEQEYTDFPMEVRSFNSSGSGGVNQTVVRTLDETPPPSSGILVIDQITHNSARVTAHSAYDSSPGSGISGYYITYGIGSPTISAGTLYGDNSYLSITGLQPNTTYQIASRAFDVAGNQATDANRAMGSFTTRSARPPLFAWDAEKYAGNPFNVTANEWRRLKDNISAVRDYLGQPAFGWNYNAVTNVGNGFSSSRWNEMRDSLYQLGTNPLPPPFHFSGDLIYATEVDQFKRSVNSIP